MRGLVNIKVTPEVAKFLKELSFEMKEQDNRWTREPYGYLYNYKKERLIPDTFDGEDYVYYDSDGEGGCIEESEVKEQYEGLLSDDPEEAKEYESFEDYLGKFEKINRMFEDEFYHGGQTGQFFLTEKASREHIRVNKHHLPNSVSDYVVHCYRNPEMEQLQSFLRGISHRETFSESGVGDYIYYLAKNEDKYIIKKAKIKAILDSPIPEYKRFRINVKKDDSDHLTDIYISNYYLDCQILANRSDYFQIEIDKLKKSIKFGINEVGGEIETIVKCSMTDSIISCDYEYIEKLQFQLNYKR